MSEQTSGLCPQRRADVLDALRRGTVPHLGLDALAVGLGRFDEALTGELLGVKRGGSGFKAVRGEYGSGKTFFGRWLQEKAKRRGFATDEVQVSETETPLHQLGTVYRRLIERLSTADTPTAAFRSVIDGWFFTLEQDVLASEEVSDSDAAGLLARTNDLMERRLSGVSQGVPANPDIPRPVPPPRPRLSGTSQRAPAFAAGLRAYRRAQAEGNQAIAEGIIAWLGGQPNVAAEVRRYALVKGAVDHYTAMGFLQGLLVVLRDSGFAGLVLVLDEVETLQRVRSDVRDKGLNALRQLIDEVDGGVFPGLYTGRREGPESPAGLQGGGLSLTHNLAMLAGRLEMTHGTTRTEEAVTSTRRARGLLSVAVLMCSSAGIVQRDIILSREGRHEREERPAEAIGRRIPRACRGWGREAGVDWLYPNCV